MTDLTSSVRAQTSIHEPDTRNKSRALQVTSS